MANFSFISLSPDLSPALLLQLFFTLAVIFCTTRLLSGRSYKAEHTGEASPGEIPTYPYWIPYIGHFFAVFYDWRTFLHRIIGTDPYGVFNLYVLGRSITVVSNMELADKILEENASLLDGVAVDKYMLAKVYGARHLHKLDSMDMLLASFAEDSIDTTNFNSVFSKALQTHLPDLVSFNDSPVDQNLWERMARPQVTEQPCGMKMRAAVKVDFVDLIRTFAGHMLGNTLLGREVLEEFPTALSDLSELNSGWKWLAIGLPSFLPVPPLTRVIIARRRLLNMLQDLCHNLDLQADEKQLEAPWRDLSDISALVWTNNVMWREEKIPINVRASALLAIISRLYAELLDTSCGMLLQIYSDPDLLARIREEIEPRTKVVQKPRSFQIAEPVHIMLDAPALSTSCSVLEECRTDCFGKYVLRSRLALITSSFNILAQGSPSAKSRSYRTQRKTHVLLPYKSIARQQVITMVAGVLALWDVSSLPADSWKASAQLQQRPAQRTFSGILGLISQRQL